ncbi:MAG TPA: type IX secretion system membrane protein PorP/SprF, partial [Bacteroidales bacterium]|nr:type IX secretion system membrane protein PorP/SprF [Bacteroidales bacterium]
MARYLITLLFIISFLEISSFGQELLPDLNYQGTMISNPALTGSEGDGLLRLSYQNLYPGNNYNLHSVCLSYDSYFPSLHGGAGFYLSDNYMGGMINDLKGGFSYSYFFRAGTDLFIGAGLSASFFHRGYDFSGTILPDQIDPLDGVVSMSSESLSSRGKTIFDVSTGFLFIAGRVFGGIAFNHLTEPDLSNSELASNRLYRKILIHGSGKIDIDAGKKLFLRPIGKIEISKRLFTAGAGVVFESRNLSLNTILLADNLKNIDLQAGFSVKTGIIVVFYDYRFNIASGENLLPVSLMHYTGIALS